MQTFDGPIELTLTLPFLLETEAGRPTTPAPVMAMPRIVERESVRIARLLEGRAFESLVAVNAELERLNLEGVPPESPARELTPLERAQEPAYDAATDATLEWLTAQTWRFPSRSRRGRRGR